MNNKHFETRSIRSKLIQTNQKEHSTPLFLNSSFTFESAEEGAAIFNGEKKGNLYSRFSNPNTDEFIYKLAMLEGTEDGIATASGMAAIHVTLSALLQSGDHILASKAIFGNSLYIINTILPKFGISYTLVDVDNNDQWESSIQSNTKLIFLESPSNPTLKIADLAFIGKICKDNDIIFCIDNCFATPYLQQPVKYGADIIIHSATKYIDGQGRVLGGAILGKSEYVKICYDFLRRTGSSLSPFNAWILSKSLETLSLRMDRHCSNAMRVAEHLSNHKLIEQVIYPHLSTHNQYDLAKKQMLFGGGLVGCVIKGGRKDGARFLNKLKLHSLTANLGDTRSIATHPASTTHSKLSSKEQLAADITPGYIRFSVGLEHIDDLISDINQALEV